MKHILTFAIALVMLSSTSQADIIWSEDFSGYADGDPVNGMATATGDGQLNSQNSVAVDADGQLLHDANTGTERTWISSNTDVLCGCFGFDLAITGTPDVAGQDQIFVQVLEGPTFSTAGSPVPNFNFNLNVTNHGISTDDTAPSAVKVFFNVSGEDFIYTAPDGSTQTLASGQRRQYVGTTLIGTGSGNAHSAGPPSAVNTLAFATFNNQRGQQFHFDNMFLDRFVHAVPEPSALVVLGMMGMATFCRRRRK